MKELVVPFKVYADFESLLKEVQSNDRNNNTSHTGKYQKHIFCSCTYKVVCIDDRFNNAVSFTEEKLQSIDLLEQFLKSMIIAKENNT